MLPYDCDARCGFAPPGTNAGTNALSATSLQLIDRDRLFIRNVPLRRDLPVFTVDWVCLPEQEAAQASAAVLM